MVNAVALLYIFPYPHSNGLQAEEQRKRLRYTLACELGGIVCTPGSISPFPLYTRYLIQIHP